MIEPFAIVSVAAKPGRIGICRLPGRSGALAKDVGSIRAWGPVLVVSLTETAEMDELGAKGLPTLLDQAGIRWRHFPIADYGVPSAGDEIRWLALADEVHAALDAGQSVLVHCRGGLGRSGMLAARLLDERGAENADAVAKVRAARPGAIETPEQEAWVASGLRRTRQPASGDRPLPAA